MNQFDVVLETEDLLVLGPIDNVGVSVDIGPTGNRGSKYIIGAGDPNDDGVVSDTEDVQIGDYFINTLSGSRYGWLYVYQTGANNVTSWVEAVKLQPSLYGNNVPFTFESGLASEGIDLTDITSDTSNVNVNRYVVQLTPISQEPLLLNLQQKRIPSPAYDKLFLDVRAMRYTLGTWVPVEGLLTIGVSVSVI